MVVVQYDLSNATKIAVNIKEIISSFKRNDRRIRKKIYLKYGMRRKNRVSQLLHGVSKDVVTIARHSSALLYLRISGIFEINIERVMDKGEVTEEK